MKDAATDRPFNDIAAGNLISAGRSGLAAFFRFACLVPMAAAVAVVRAADDNKIIFPSGNPSAGAAATGSTTGGASAFTLVAAVLIAAVGAWFYWRNRKTPLGARGAQNLAIEETRSLGNRQYLVVARYGDEKFLLGVCPGRIDMLTPLQQREEGHEL
jgi:flagellar protein FliO/FliZ